MDKKEADASFLSCGDPCADASLAQARRPEMGDGRQPLPPEGHRDTRGYDRHGQYRPDFPVWFAPHEKRELELMADYEF
jgi:hypothetical protein